MPSHVAVVTDSAASLPDVLVRKWGIGVVPLQIVVGDESRPEGGKGDSARVLADLEAGVEMKTSQPVPRDFVEAYQRAHDAGASAVVAVHISGAMSGTANGAHVAARDAPLPVTVVDTRTLAMATGFSALAAARAAGQGASVDEVEALAHATAASSACYFTVDTLEYLKRGGRVSGPLAVLGEALSIRPVLEIKDGEVALVDRVRTTVRARAAVVDLAAAKVAALNNPGLSIMALGEQEYAADAAAAVESRHSHIAMTVRTPVSAVLSAHTGPGTLAAAIVDLPEGFR